MNFTLRLKFQQKKNDINWNKLDDCGPTRELKLQIKKALSKSVHPVASFEVTDLKKNTVDCEPPPFFEGE